MITAPAAQLDAMTDRIIAEALADARLLAALRDWLGLEDVMATRLPELCRDAVSAALWARWRLGYARVGRS